MNANPLAPLAASLGSPRALAPSSGASAEARAAERAKVAELAREFEAMMMRQVLQQMREMLAEDDETGLGAGTMTATIDVELTRVLAASRPTGLAAALQPALERTAGSDGGPGDSPLASASPDPLDAPAGPALPLPLPARVTSGFGMRRDPFGNGERFHAGVDIAAPAGREVPAVADGRVSFAGSRPGYGNLVVIDHADGTSTRYAHLERIGVQAGDTVDAGRSIGTVGTTGRSTGPHLHFELRQNGRPVNPVAAAARLAGALKNVAAVAD